jgi:hypothetical protein
MSIKFNLVLFGKGGITGLTTVHKTKKNKNTTQYVMDTTMRKQTQITEIRHELSYKQLYVLFGKGGITGFVYS